jgi:mRNA interferase MazF
MPKKVQLDSLTHTPPHVSERDVWWASVGENVGSEMDGKSELFSRPVIIFRKLAHGFYFVIPTSTKAKEGSWYTPFTHNGKSVVACLHQARAIDYRRLSNKLGQIDTADFGRIQNGFATLYIKNIPHSFEQGRG